MIPPRRRWFAFSLRTMFVGVTLLGSIGYWLACESTAHRARNAYEQVDVLWRARMVFSREVCEASLRLFQAECRVPFADQHKAAIAHRDRIERVLDRDYGPASEWEMGVSDDKSYAEALAGKAEIEQYYADAEARTR